MGLLKHFRSKSRLKESPPRTSTYNYPALARGGRNFTQQLPDNVLERIFSFVCPHVQDDTYQSSESSQIGDGCMLCDLRDLARCASICRRWYRAAQRLLYTSIRIDAVHYCALEEVLGEKRRKAGKHFKSKSHVGPDEVPGIRLSLLCKTVRENRGLAQQVLFLKLPYMTRETCKADLARTVSALPNLRYVDLPDGFFSDEASCLPLRQELQSQCPQIRKMVYRAGAEDSLEAIAQRQWQHIEELELSDLALEPAALRIVLGSLPVLQQLTLSHLPWLDDSAFQSSALYPEFPPLKTLTMKDTPNVTAAGLATYLEAPENRESLLSLTIEDTGILVPELHTVLWTASSLQHLAITETVSKSLTLTQNMPPLTSISLKILNYEIISSDDVHGLQKPTESYYAYLASSLHANALPALRTVYVREQSFPDLLLLPPLHGSSYGGPSNAGSSLSVYSQRGMPFAPQNSSFNQTLEVFSKGIDELEWVFTHITPPAQTHDLRGNATGGRPLSAYSASRGLGPQWAQGGFGGEARKSVVVSNGFGGFLAVPQEEVPRPMTSDGPRSKSENKSSSFRDSFLKPPPSLSSITNSVKTHARKGSRQDLWR